MSIAEKINLLIEQMPENKQTVLLELVKTMVEPDDILTDEDISDIKRAREEFARGEYLTHEEVWGKQS